MRIGKTMHGKTFRDGVFRPTRGGVCHDKRSPGRKTVYGSTAEKEASVPMVKDRKRRTRRRIFQQARPFL